MKTIEDILASAGAGAYGEDSDLIGKVFGVVMATVLVNKGAGPFICGTLRKPGTDGLHEGSELPDLCLVLDKGLPAGCTKVRGCMHGADREIFCLSNRIGC